MRPLHEVEREHILATLDACKGNIKLTAETLQISRATLYRRLKDYYAQLPGLARAAGVSRDEVQVIQGNIDHRDLAARANIGLGTTTTRMREARALLGLPPSRRRM